MITTKAMKLFIPSIGEPIVLTQDWTFTLNREYRNASLWFHETGKDISASYIRDSSIPDEITVTLPAGTVLSMSRIYIKKGQSDFDSVTFIVKKSPFPRKGLIRFWVKLKETRNVEFSPFEE